MQHCSTCVWEPRKEYPPTRGLGSDLVNLVPYLGDELGVVGIIKKLLCIVKLSQLKSLLMELELATRWVSKYLLIVELVSDGRGVSRQPADEEVGLEVHL